MPTAAYQNKQKYRINVQFFSYILIKTNTFHIKACFRPKSTLQYIGLRNVSHETAHNLAEKKGSYFKNSHAPYSNLNHAIHSKTKQQ